MSIRHAAAGAILIALAATAGCGSGGTTSAGSSGPASQAAHGASIKVGLIAEGSGVGAQLHNLTVGATAAARAINDAGGVDGRPIQVVTCDTNNNPNDAAACARHLVSEKVAAVVGSATQYGANVIPVLNQAHIASLGQIGVGQADLANPNGFPLAPVGIDVAAGAPDLLARQGSKKISLVRVDVSATAALAQLAVIGLKPHGLSLLNNVAVPANAPDMSPYVASASGNGTDGIVMFLTPADLAKFASTARGSGFAGKLVTSGNGIQQLLDQGLRSALEGVYLVDVARPPSDTASAAVKKMVAEVHAVDSSIDIDFTVEDAWASVYLFKQAASAASTVDATGVLAAMPKVTNFDVGVFPSINFSQPLTAIPGLHVFNPYVFYEQVRGGKIVPLDSGFVKLLS